MISRATPEKSLRIAWEGGTTRVDVYFYAKGPGRSQVSVDHRKLPSAVAAARMRVYWSARLAALKELLV